VFGRLYHTNWWPLCSHFLTRDRCCFVVKPVECFAQKLDILGSVALREPGVPAAERTWNEEHEDVYVCPAVNHASTSFAGTGGIGTGLAASEKVTQGELSELDEFYVRLNATGAEAMRNAPHFKSLIDLQEWVWENPDAATPYSNVLCKDIGAGEFIEGLFRISESCGVNNLF